MMPELPPRNEITVEMEDKEQGIVVFDGTGPIVLIDEIAPADACDYFSALSRKVLVARLRYWADVLDDPDTESAVTAGDSAPPSVQP